MSKTERVVLCLAVMIAVFFAAPLSAGAMHIMEGYLPLGYSVAWSVLSLPFLVMGFIQLRRIVTENRRTLVLLAMSGAFIFVISSLKIPSVTGSCSHMTGTGLAAILFGLSTTSVLGAIVLLFQAILLAHGGLTTLGANVFSMAVVGPALTILLYHGGKKLKLNRTANVLIAASLGDLLTYCVTSLQLALAHPSEVGGVAASAMKFLGVFAPTQIPLAIVEGIFTALIVIGMEKFAARELEALSYVEVA